MKSINIVQIQTSTIRLDQFLKWSGAALTGGEGKIMISEGLIEVNGVPEKKRGRIIKKGDKIEIVRFNSSGEKKIEKVLMVSSGGQ